MLTLQNNSEYQNEWDPAHRFCKLFEKYFGQKINDCTKNEKESYPDYFLKVDKVNIDLEVTTFTKEKIFENKDFWEDINQIGNQIIDKHKSLLSPGRYSIVITPIKGKNKLEKALEKNIPDLFHRLEKKVSAEIELKSKDSSDGKIQICNIGNSEKIVLELIFKIYDPLFNSQNWGGKDFTNYLQTVIDNKEKKINQQANLYYQIIRNGY